jgi:hypothetical protein
LWDPAIYIAYRRINWDTTRNKHKSPPPTNSQAATYVDGWALRHSLLVVGGVTDITIGMVMVLHHTKA